jgi:transcriptional regulator with XRE-family HTH domain
MLLSERKGMDALSDQQRVIFSERLRAARTDQNLTQESLADQAGFAREMIARYETQKSFPNIDTLVKISKILNVTTDYLLGLTDDPQFEQPVLIAAQRTEGMPPGSEERLEEIIQEAVRKIRKLSGRPEKDK